MKNSNGIIFKRVHFGALVVLTFVMTWLASPVAATLCQSCERVVKLREMVSNSDFSTLLLTLDQPATVVFSVNGGGFCEGEGASPLSAEVTRMSDQVFGRADQLATKTSRCSAQCAPTINEAEYSALGGALAMDTAYLERLSDALGVASLTYDNAATSGHLASAGLAEQMTLLGNESFDLLKQGLLTLNSDDSRSIDEGSWSLNGRDLAEFGFSLDLMQAFALIKGDASKTANAIIRAGQEMQQVGTDIKTEMGRARLSEPADKAALANRILQTAMWLVEGIESLKQSAQADQTAAALKITTVANVAPDSALATGYGAAGQCFSRLALSASVAGEGLSITKDLLQGCRAFGAASSNTASPSQFGGTTRLVDFLARQAKADKALYAVEQSMCRAN